MLVLRCTKRLLQASRIAPVAEPPLPTGALGEWYANQLPLPFPGRSLVMFVHGGTLLSALALGRVLGSMNDIAEHIRAEAEWAGSFDRLDLRRLEDRLAGVIFGALSYRCPIDEFRDLAAS